MTSNMPMQMNGVLTVILGAVVLAGCATGPEPASGPLPPPQPRATVLVENQSTSEMRVFAILGTQRIRLGSVGGNRTVSLRIPDHIVAQGREVGFQVDPIAGRAVTSNYTIYVRPGDEVRLTIPPQIR